MPNSGTKKQTTQLTIKGNGLTSISLSLAERSLILAFTTACRDEREHSMDWRPVYAAASKYNVEDLKKLEAEGISLSLADPVQFCTPLYSASFLGCVESISFLLSTDEGASSVNAATGQGATPAYAASLQGHIEILKQLHSEGADLAAAENRQGVSPLMAAVFHRRSECLSYLLQVDHVVASVNYRDSTGMSALWGAVHCGDEQAIRLLINAGAVYGDAPPPAARSTFDVPMHEPAVALVSNSRATKKEKVVGVRLPKILGASSVGPESDRLPAPTLMRAAAEGDMPELTRLASLGEDLDHPDDEGRTPLILAAMGNHSTATKFLCGRGSNKEARDVSGATPLHLAARAGHTDTVRVLLFLCGADVGAVRVRAGGGDGATALWLACDGGHEATVAAILEHPHVELNAATKDGVRPIEAACARNHGAVVDLLLSKGVSSLGISPGMWVGLSFGKRLMRRQLPEILETQRLAEEESRLKAEAEAEVAAAAAAAEKEAADKAASGSKKAKDEKAPSSKKKKK